MTTKNKEGPRQEISKEQGLWTELLKKGYQTLGYLGWQSEDLTQPEEDVIRIGFKDMNGLAIPPITMPAEKWIITAKLILAKYGEKK